MIIRQEEILDFGRASQVCNLSMSQMLSEYAANCYRKIENITRLNKVSFCWRMQLKSKRYAILL